MSTILNYDLSPYGAVKGENVTLTLTITNPSNGKKQDNITVSLQFDSNLTANSADVHPSSKEKNWSNVHQTTSSGVIFVIQPDDGVSLEPGKSAQFSFSNVSITDNNTTGEIALIEQVDGETHTSNLKVLKMQPKLDIVGYANPVKIGKGQSTTLFFTSNAASKIIIEPIGKEIKTKVQGNGQTFSTSLEVTPEVQNGDNYTSSYTLTAYNDAGDYFPFIINVYTEKPVISSFKAEPATDVSLDDDNAVTLSWETLYSNVTYLQPQYGGPMFVANNGQQTYSGQQLKQFLRNSPNQSSLEFTLIVDNGDGYQHSSSISVELASASILYFKFKNSNLTYPIYAAKNAVDAIMQGGDGEDIPSTYTVDGPGGPLEQYLGGKTDVPQIKYFSPDKEDIKAGDKITLSWVVQNISKMTLTPGNIDAPIDAEGKGSVEVTVSQDTNYVLTSQSGLTSTLAVEVTNSDGLEQGCQ